MEESGWNVVEMPGVMARNGRIEVEDAQGTGY